MTASTAAVLHFQAAIPYSIKHSLEGSLGRAVWNGYLDLTNADIAVINHCLKAHREGRHTDCAGDPLDCAAARQRTLRWVVKRLEDESHSVTGGIRQVLGPLLLRRVPVNVLLAEAHNVNGEHDFPFTEDQVTDIVAEVVYWHQRRRHGG